MQNLYAYYKFLGISYSFALKYFSRANFS